MLSFILVILAAIAKAVMDTVQFHYAQSVFRYDDFWNAAESWKYKWKNGDKAQGEAFLWSSTLFVFLTDGWHAAQAVFLGCMFISMVGFQPLFHLGPPVLTLFLHYMGLRVVFGLTFELFFSKLLIR